MFNKLKVLHI